MDKFYGISSGETFIYIIAAVQLIITLAFVSGVQKRISYGLVLLIHGISTFASYEKYIDGFNNLLFFAAFPMLAACLALYLLRDLDTKFTLSSK